ncbi:MAG: phosphoribosyltransferase [Chitinophagales bacterium]|nr:phosphoribosyltransferase [Chitinophagales bacterium]
MLILNHDQIKHKISRISYEILERHDDDNTIHLVGINNNGYRFASLLYNQLKTISAKDFQLSGITLNPAQPLMTPIDTELEAHSFDGKSVILVDDVANTGRTLFYAFIPFLKTLPARVEVAVLVDRKHKLFPVNVDYVGLSLATTVQDNISAKLTDSEAFLVEIM